MLTQERAKQIFEYDYDDGVLVGNKNGLRHTATNSRGYVVVWADGKAYQAHRIIWLLHYGAFPKHEIDHINRCKSDNRIANLRELCRAENQRNTSVYKNSASKLKGASYRKDYGNWRAHISINGKSIHLGYFKTANEAHTAYLNALQGDGNEN